ncbi:MAG TPA: S8 family peptidase [Flavobacteriaceae bacterium]|nr:S8 family peptidase [Flavobacteriaceae bacterium]
MKQIPLKLIFTYLFAMTFCTFFGQRQLAKKPLLQNKQISKPKPINPKFSGATALFLNSIDSASKTSRIKKNGTEYINTAIVLYDGCSVEDIENLPIQINTGNKNIITALIPPENFQLVSENDCIKLLDIGVPVKTTMDEARDHTYTDLVHEGVGLNSSYDGSGVIVGIIDIGFDFTHPTFLDSNGNLRVSRVWIQGDDSGSTPTGYNYGSEYVGETQILTKQTDTNTESHGTHVTGIATGSGIDGSDNEYKGIAYNSEIVLVSYTLPSNQQISNNNINIIDALNYLVNYANSQNKPLVINMSLGSHFGPHDGTSLLDQAIDNLVDDGIIVVGSAGNEGNKKLHVSSTFTNEDIKYYFVENDQNLLTYIDIWGSENTDFEFSYGIYNINTDVWIDVSPETYISSNHSTQKLNDFIDSDDNDKWTVQHNIPQLDPNLKSRVIIGIDYSNDLTLGDGDVFLLGITAQNTTVHAWTSPSNGSTTFENHGYSTVEDGDTDYTVGEIGGTANDIISVGAYTTKNSYTDISSNTQNIDYYSEIEDIAPFSSKGPTVDGRTKPDITAPGNVVVSSVNSFDDNYDLESPKVVLGVTNGIKNWYYAINQGTSMSAPVVTGIIALWLDIRPDLDPNDIKTIFDYAAIQDSFTGSTINNTWGWGKIDAWYASYLIEQSLNTNTFENQKPVRIYPNPTLASVYFDNSRTNFKHVEVFNSLGQLMLTKSLSNEVNSSIDLSGVSDGLYFLRFYDQNQSIYTFKVVKSK